jgi:hypothetical protein
MVSVLAGKIGSTLTSPVPTRAAMTPWITASMPIDATSPAAGGEWRSGRKISR